MLHTTAMYCYNSFDSCSSTCNNIEYVDGMLFYMYDMYMLFFVGVVGLVCSAFLKHVSFNQRLKCGRTHFKDIVVSIVESKIR